MKFKICTFAITSLLAFSANFANAQNTSPSFDCKLAKTKIEKEICANPILAQKDVFLNKLYNKTRTFEFNSLKTGEIIAQKKWLKNLNSCSLKPQDEFKECLINSYDARVSQLAISLLFIDSKLAFDAMETYSFNTKNLYHALFEYVETPKSNARDIKIANYLRLHFNNLFENNEFPKSLLEGEKIFKPEDALISDDKFFQALALITLSDDEEFTIPCHAMLKNPKAIKATEAYFGSSWDGQLPNSNCEEFLPNLPNLSAFNANLWENLPECTGTIRFAFYRELNVNYDEILLGRYKIVGKNKRYNKETLNFKSKNNAKFEMAAKELVNYYNQTKFKSGANLKLTSAILADYIDKAMETGC